MSPRQIRLQTQDYKLQLSLVGSHLLIALQDIKTVRNFENSFTWEGLECKIIGAFNSLSELFQSIKETSESIVIRKDGTVIWRYNVCKREKTLEFKLEYCQVEIGKKYIKIARELQVKQKELKNKEQLLDGFFKQLITKMNQYTQLEKDKQGQDAKTKQIQKLMGQVKQQATEQSDSKPHDGIKSDKSQKNSENESQSYSPSKFQTMRQNEQNQTEQKQAGNNQRIFNLVFRDVKGKGKAQSEKKPMKVQAKKMICPHNDRKILARGLCSSCYNKQRKQLKKIKETSDIKSQEIKNANDQIFKSTFKSKFFEVPQEKQRKQRLQKMIKLIMQGKQ